MHLPRKLELSKLAAKLPNAEYNAKQHNSLRMKMTKPNASVLLFASGKMIVTGLKTRTKYEPERFLAATYRCPDGVTMNVFTSGKVMILNGRSEQQILDAFEEMRPHFEDCKKKIPMEPTSAPPPTTSPETFLPPDPLCDAAPQPFPTSLPPFPVFNDDPLPDATFEQQIPGAFEYFPVFSEGPLSGARPAWDFDLEGVDDLLW
uniref:TATA-box-binding protein n=1 Tax=Steinernema glaseri TaxID=37863 RepID=A0A1I8AWJ2_9BILA